MQVFFFIYRAQHLLLKDKFLFMGLSVHKTGKAPTLGELSPKVTERAISPQHRNFLCDFVRD